MRHRLFADLPFAPGATLALTASAARHVQVLRLQPGTTVTLFNGSDGAEWPAEIIRIGRSGVDVLLDAPAFVERELGLAVTLAIGVPANDRMDALIEKAGELGATTIQPLLCARSVVRLGGERAAAKRQHWRGVAAAASEQCGRTRVSAVAPVRTLLDWLAGLDGDADAASTDRGSHLDAKADVGGRGADDADSDATGNAAPAPQRIVLSLQADAAPSPTALAGLVAGGLRHRRFGLLVLSGPEGGLTAEEENAATRHGFVRVGLGPRVLRADTAPLALLAWLALQMLCNPS